ncbi:hypothetical protein [Flavobacterium cellulosilyticum]|nr:hypothetical protein [Flavobacterium cellulosilyticum]
MENNYLPLKRTYTFLNLLMLSYIGFTQTTHEATFLQSVFAVTP